MTKKLHREEDRVEYLEREIRELKATNRSLLKRLKKVDKGGSKEDRREKDKQLYVESSFIEEEETPTFNCPSCSRGNVNKVSVAGRTFFKCQICEYRTKAEKTT